MRKGRDVKSVIYVNMTELAEFTTCSVPEMVTLNQSQTARAGLLFESPLSSFVRLLLEGILADHC